MSQIASVPEPCPTDIPDDTRLVFHVLGMDLNKAYKRLRDPAFIINVVEKGLPYNPLKPETLFYAIRHYDPKKKIVSLRRINRDYGEAVSSGLVSPANTMKEKISRIIEYLLKKKFADKLREMGLSDDYVRSLKDREFWSLVYYASENGFSPIPAVQKTFGSGIPVKVWVDKGRLWAEVLGKSFIIEPEETYIIGGRYRNFPYFIIRDSSGLRLAGEQGNNVFEISPEGRQESLKYVLPRLVYPRGYENLYLVRDWQIRASLHIQRENSGEPLLYAYFVITDKNDKTKLIVRDIYGHDVFNNTRSLVEQITSDINHYWWRPPLAVYTKIAELINDAGYPVDADWMLNSLTLYRICRRLIGGIVPYRLEEGKHVELDWSKPDYAIVDIYNDLFLDYLGIQGVRYEKTYEWDRESYIVPFDIVERTSPSIEKLYSVLEYGFEIVHEGQKYRLTMNWMLYEALKRIKPEVVYIVPRNGSLEELVFVKDGRTYLMET